MRYFARLILIPSLIFLLASCSDKIEFKEKFSFLPKDPEPGEEITILFMADSTELKDAEEIEAVAYLYSRDLDETKSVEMKKVDKGWVGKITTSDSTKGVIIKFKNKEITDNNSKKGYIIYLYNDGKILPGSVAGLGGAIYIWGSYYVDLERDIELAESKILDDFKDHPEIKPDYLDSYFDIISRKYPSKKDSIIQSELSAIENSGVDSEVKTELLADWYYVISDTVKAEKYKNILEEKYPGNIVLQSRYLREINRIKNVDEKIEFVKSFEEKFPESRYNPSLYDAILNTYRDNKQYNEAKNFLEKNKEKPTPYRFFTIALKMIEEDADLNTALIISEMGVERSRKEVASPSARRPNYLTDKEWKTDREYILGLNLYAYGKILDKMNKKDQALSPAKEAVEVTNKEDAEINEFYSTLLIDNKQYEKAMAELEGFIEESKSTSAMNDLLKTAYINKNGSQEGYEEYLSKFKSAAKENLRAELQKKMVNDPAPDFSLTDLKGNKVSLSDFKGKTVIIDFWATWCGPCISSFPGLKKAVENYSENKNVKFLFINSWERVDNKKENAEEFIEKNNYPFHVLMDTENEVVSRYKVSGIPTKFIIDKNGKIRFVSIGYSGNNDQMIEEISEMITMVN